MKRRRRRPRTRDREIILDFGLAARHLEMLRDLYGISTRFDRGSDLAVALAAVTNGHTGKTYSEIKCGLSQSGDVMFFESAKGSYKGSYAGSYAQCAVELRMVRWLASSRLDGPLGSRRASTGAQLSSR